MKDDFFCRKKRRPNIADVQNDVFRLLVHTQLISLLINSFDDFFYDNALIVSMTDNEAFFQAT